MKLHVSAFKVREAHPAPSSAAIALDKAHVQQVQQATMELMEICSKGVFVAGRAALLDSPLIIYADINDIRMWAKKANFSGASS